MQTSDQELATSAYWDARYSEVEGDSQVHEWFRSYSDLQPFLARHLFQAYPPAAQPSILHLGAGDSTIPRDLLREGYTHQTCVDFSQTLIDRMVARNLEGVTWLLADVRDMPAIQSDSIDVAFDKGTLDAMIHGSPWDPPDEVKQNSAHYMQEVARALKHDGTFLYVTYRQPHFVKPLLNQDNLWQLDMETLQSDENSFEYYAFVMKKAART